MNKVATVAGGILLAASVGAAQAGCVGHGMRFRVDLNQEVSNRFATDNGRCMNKFRAGGRTVYTAASIAATPQHGTLRQVERFGFLYQANPGYKGEDRYAIKICGTGLAGSGCATLNYLGTIE